MNIKRNDTVVLNRDLETLNNSFKKGDAMKFLAFQGTMVRLSRRSDCAKLTTLAANVGIEMFPELKPTSPLAPRPSLSKYDAPHSDESGPSRRIVIASCLAGKFSGDVVTQLTPAEEREYNDGMAKLAALG